MALEIRPADPGSAGLRALMADHLADMESATPDPSSRHALDLDALFGDGVEVWVCLIADQVVGAGAVQQLDEAAGELKAMRTASTARRRGVGSAVLDHLLEVCRSRGYSQVFLETGTQDFFAPARRLYASRGFLETEPFGSYVEDPSSVHMRLSLT